MRIISGSKRGKKILLPDLQITRPLRDYVKENIFNLINHNKDIKINLENKIIFDFFSGSGSFGIECLSRGAKYVCFVENNKSICEILKKNLTIFDKSLYKIFEEDYFNLDLAKLNIYVPDIIFFDPPYDISFPSKIFRKILNINYNLEKSLIIFHTFKNNIINFYPEFFIIQKKNYGLSDIFFLKAKF